MKVKARIRDHWDSRGKRYDTPVHVCLREVWRDLFAEIFEGRKRILDVGTGTGFVAGVLAELGHEVVGLDISRGMIEVAIEKCPDVEFVLGDAEDLPFEDDSFDAVVCRHLLWTLPNPRRAVEEWARVAKEKIVIVDGRWKKKGIGWIIRRILTAVRERRIRFHYGDLGGALPFYGGPRPEEVIELVRSVGLDVRVRDLTWIRKRQKDVLPLVYKIGWSVQDYFMVEGLCRYQNG